MSYGGYTKTGNNTSGSHEFGGENIFEHIGHPGKYVSSVGVADGQTDYTGSNYGAAAVIVKTHGSAVFHLSGGGEVAATNLTAGVLYPLSLKKITAASSATIFVLKIAAPINGVGKV